MKWTSVACAYLMVIAAFYVMTADVSAEEVALPDDDVDEIISNIEHNDRRITISNSMASSPCVAVGPDSTAHIAWVDGRIGSQSVSWKCSNDSMSTFTSDETISTSFYSISNISIVLGSAFGTAIAFEGKLTADAMPSVYFLYSEDDDDWSTAYAVSVGSSPSLTTDGDAVYIAMNIISDEATRYSLAAFRLIDGSVNATLLAALPVSASDGDIAFFDDMLNVAMIEDSSDALYFMQITDNGTVVTDPTLVSRTDGGSSVDLMSVNGHERILYVENDSIMLACCLGAASNWISHTVIELNDTISEASLAASGSSLRIAYTVVTDGCSSVYVTECDLQGNAGDAKQISTSGLDAFSPAIFSITSGSFSCVYAEEHSDTQELFMSQDIEYVVPDITRLSSYISSIDHKKFRHGNNSMSELNERIGNIIAHRNNSEEALAIENASDLRDELDSYFVSTPYADLDGIEDVQDVIVRNLVSVSATATDDVSTTGITSTVGASGFFSSLLSSCVISDITNSTATAQWTSSSMAIMYVLWGTSTSTLPNYAVATMSQNWGTNDYTAPITGLSSNTTYYAIQSTTTSYWENIWTSPTSFMTYPDQISIYSISITTASGCANITWATDVESDSRVDYGTTSSYGNHVESSTLTTSHSLTISDLGSNAVYHYKVSSTYSMNGFSIASNTTDCSFTSAQVIITISNIDVTLTSPISARINWQTNVAANSTVCYGTTTSYGHTASGDTGTYHTVNLTGLSTTTTYHFYVMSTASADTNSSNESGDDTFTTQDLSITSVSSALNGPNSVKITWTTNYESTTVVKYGTTTSYTTTRTGTDGIYHSRILSNLATSTTYHYQVQSSTSGYTKSSTDRTFTTSDLTMSSPVSALIDLNSVRITWTTNYAATSVVQYGLTSSYGTTATGTSDTSHTVDITDLTGGATYHYKVTTAYTGDNNVNEQSTDLTFSTKIVGDAGLGVDAADDIGTASLLTPGTYLGYLDSALDVNDYYGVPLLNGQTIRVALDVPTSFDYQLYLYNPSGTLASSSTGGTSVDENVQLTVNASGVWKVRLYHNAGTNQGSYSLSVRLLGGSDRFSVDVGSAGDNYLMQNLPGLNILNGTGWGTASGGSRQAVENSCFLLNIYDGTYQSSTYYQLSIAYTASADVGVQMLVGDSWVTVTTLPGSTAANTYSFVLKSEWLTDSSGTLFACNVKLRFSYAIVVDSIDAVAVAYVSDFFGTSQNYPGVMLENNWAIDDAVVNGSVSATLLITLPRSDQTYLLEFVGLDSYTGIGVQQYVTSAYASIGTLESWGTSAVVQLNPTYTDAQGTTPGSTVRIKLTSAIKNLTRVVLWTSRYYTDVGVSGDTTGSSHTPGISLLDNGEWGAITSSGSVYWRNTVSGNNANFYLNGAESDAQYLISITYKVTSGTTSLKQFINSTGTAPLGSFTTGTAWRTDMFVTSAITYDSVAGGQINIMFEITSTTTVAVDSITVYKDSDGDTYSDAYEALRVTMSAIGTHTYDLDPFSADTDTDGLNDNVERTSSYLTDPTDADSDNDDLTDGSEKYSYTWSTDESHLIPDGSSKVTISLSVPAISGTISSFCLVIGIMHGAETQLRVQMSKGATGTTKTIKASGTGSGANYYALVNLFSLSSPYSASDLTSASTWKINVTDITAGTEGRVEYVRLQVNGTTNVLDRDSDDDGLSDGEEVNFGIDGWYTNPRSSDSDSDGVSDGNEVSGITLCSYVTDPTRADTDDDGYNDNVDRYMGDAVLRVSILEYRTREDINYDDDRTIFFVIKYNGEMLSTKRMAAHTDTLYYPGWTYDIDIAETVTSVSVIFYAVADNAGTVPGDDIKLDVSSTSNLEHTVTWTLSTTQYQTSFQGTCGWLDNDADGYMKVGLQRTVAEKAKVIVVNGTGDDGDYGLDQVSTGVYRYSADDQVFLINLNVSSANARFQQGMNTIILPRAIALQCQLNDTLYDLQSIGSTPLADASFYSTDQDSASASSHVIAVITKNVTYQQAEAILEMLTHNSTGARIGNNVTISSTSVYLMHLPKDILSSIPTSITNSGLGGAPNFFDPLDVISDIANLVFDFLIWIATGGVLLLWAHLMIIGLEIVANLISTAISVIEDAVDFIVDGFCAFVDWIVDFIRYLLGEQLNQEKQTITDSNEPCFNSLNSKVSKASQAYNNNEVSQADVDDICISIFNSDMINCLAISSLIILLITTILYRSIPCSFIGDILFGELINFLAATPLVMLFYFAIDNWGDWVWEMLGDDQSILFEGFLAVATSLIGAIIAYVAHKKVANDIFILAVSLFSVFLAIAATQINDYSTSILFGVTGLVISIASYLVSLAFPINPFSNPIWKAIVKISPIASIAIDATALASTISNHYHE
ncbi:MAG: fibronectin type III domain-containing protein [Methanomassiliicoccales archaeon]|nr:fibronectin type III domain-containing protein [Methanomassiliicoccales archaeon]